MELSWILAQQVLIMFLLIAVGIFCYKKKIIHGDGSKQLSELLMIVVMPCLVVNAYQVDYDPEILKGLLLAFGLAIFTHILGIILVKFVFRKKHDPRYRVERFATVYSNAGFMGLPLVEAAIGSEGVIFATAYLATFNFFAFTMGEMELKGENRPPHLRKLISHPGIWSVALAIILYFLRIHLPMPIGPVVNYIASMNTPLAMIACGIFLAEANLKGMWKNKNLYLVAAMRLLIFPLLLVFIYKLTGVMHWFEEAEMVVLISLITAACPTAALASIMSRKFGQDAAYGGQLVAFTTVCSIVTLPLVIMVAQMI